MLRSLLMVINVPYFNWILISWQRTLMTQIFPQNERDEVCVGKMMKVLELLSTVSKFITSSSSSWRAVQTRIWVTHTFEISGCKPVSRFSFFSREQTFCLSGTSSQISVWYITKMELCCTKILFSKPQVGQIKTSFMNQIE